MTGTRKDFAAEQFSASEEQLAAGQQHLARSLEIARKELDKAFKSYPVLGAPGRAMGRIARAASRPIRVAILGESNTGKSTIANLLIGGMTLPASPVANTRLPTLLYHAVSPNVSAVLSGGTRMVLTPRHDGARLDIVRLEVGLPVAFLRSVELLDFPGSANPLLPTRAEEALRHRIDAAIWATVATQAWRETERAAWSRLPPRIASRGVMAVTHCDLVTTAEDFAKLKARLQTVARERFTAICFLEGAGAGRAKAPGGSGVAELFSIIHQISQQFAAERLGKALHLSRKLAARVLARLEGGESGV
jgi:GTPase SAR1 family protein